MARHSLSVAELEEMIDKQKAALLDLIKQRETVQHQLDKIDAEIETLSGGGLFVHHRRRKRRRVKNELSLKATVLDVLGKTKKGYTLADLASKVLETGYKSTSKNFRNVLYQCVYNTEGILHDESSGCYVLQR